jgi:hypothetical protein
MVGMAKIKSLWQPLCVCDQYKNKIDESVESQKINLSSFRRKPESSHFNSFWTPAFAGVTGLRLF